MVADTSHQRHLFIRRLAELHDLSVADERAVLGALCPQQDVPKGQDIVADGIAPRSVSIVVRGVACRYKLLSGGQRQILGFLLPGDMTGDLAGSTTPIDHGVCAATECAVEGISQSAFQQLMESFPNVARAVWRYCVIQASISRSWLVNMRRRSAPERLAYLLCEQFARLQVIGLVEQGKAVPYHIVQSDLADATGMSVIHVNRTLQHLRSLNLVGRNPAALEILNWDGLRELAEFDPGYLCFHREQEDGFWSTARGHRAQRGDGFLPAPARNF